MGCLSKKGPGAEPLAFFTPSPHIAAGAWALLGFWAWGFEAVYGGGLWCEWSWCFLAEQSQPEAGAVLFWGVSCLPLLMAARGLCSLLRRTWHITDAQGRVQHVHGEGVIGQQPVFAAGASGMSTAPATPLPTASGFYARRLPYAGAAVGCCVLTSPSPPLAWTVPPPETPACIKGYHVTIPGMVHLRPKTMLLCSMVFFGFWGDRIGRVFVDNVLYCHYGRVTNFMKRKTGVRAAKKTLKALCFLII